MTDEICLSGELLTGAYDHIMLAGGFAWYAVLVRVEHFFQGCAYRFQLLCVRGHEPCGAVAAPRMREPSERLPHAAFLFVIYHDELYV